MDEISIPYHLLIPTVFCILGIAIILFNRKKLFSKNKTFWRSVMFFLIIYLLIVGRAAFNDIYYEWDLNNYDLDKDGIFSGEEITEEQKIAMQKLTNDVGRNFSFITGFVFALFIALAAFLFGKLFSGQQKNI